MHATRAAVEEGILPGGGVALLRASAVLKKAAHAERRPEDRRRDRAQGASRPRRARSRSTPAKTARSSSARSWRRTSTASASTPRTASTCNMVSKGIIDPTKVVRRRLQGAASVAGLLITTEAMVAEVPRKQAPAMPGARRRDGRNGRNGLLIRPDLPRLNPAARPRPRPFDSSPTRDARTGLRCPIADVGRRKRAAISQALSSAPKSQRPRTRWVRVHPASPT